MKSLNKGMLSGLSAIAIMSSLTACPEEKCYWKDEECIDAQWNDLRPRYVGEECNGDEYFGSGYSYDENKKASKTAVSAPYSYCASDLVCVWDDEQNGAFCVNICIRDSDCREDGLECVKDSRIDSDNTFNFLYAGHCAQKASAEAICGNGVVEEGETCDDGAKKAGDGCSKSCQIEAGWDCVADANGKSVCSVKECHSEEECNGDGDSDGSSDGLTDSSSDALTDILPDDGQSDIIPGDDDGNSDGKNDPEEPGDDDAASDDAASDVVVDDDEENSSI